MASPRVQRMSSAFSRTSSGSPRLQVLASHRSSSLSRFDRESLSENAADAAAAEAASRAAIEEFKNDKIFSKFLVDDFNVTQFASEALSSGSAAASSEKLREGIELLERQLRSEVFLRHDELLEQLSSLKETESVLTVVRAGVEGLQASTQRVRAEIAEPYKHIKTKSRQLASLHDTVELLRTVIRVLKLVKRLHELMESGSATADLAKGAQLYNEIETLRKETDLAGVEVLYNMGELKPTVENLIGKYKGLTVKSVSAALAMKPISSSVGSSLGSGSMQRTNTSQGAGNPRSRESLWQKMGTCMDQLHGVVVEVWHLQRVLAKKRDPISHVVFLDEVMQPGDPMLAERVWETVVKSFATQMKSAFTASSFVKDPFVVGYPKLLGMVDGLLERLFRDTNVKGVPPAIKPEARDQLVAALEPFQTAYLGKSLGRLSELVNSMFPSAVRGSIPSQEQVFRLVSRIQEELDIVKSDVKLTFLVLQEIGEILRLLAEKAEYQTATGPESRQVVGSLTPQQLKNITLSLQLQDVHARVTAMLVGLPSAAIEVLSPSLGSLYGVASDCITTLFKAMMERLENCILQIHEQSFASEDMDAGMGNGCSKYMEDVQKSIMHFRSEFLSKLLAGPTLAITSVSGESISTGLARKLASRVLLFWVRHAAMVRPLSESGKLQLISDMAELELVVGQSLFPVEQLGAPYRAFRAFKPLVFLETSDFASSPSLHELPPTIVLHHLYTRAPVDLESPMQRMKLSPQQYSLWLDAQGEEQAWKGIKTTLDEYAAKVQARGDKEFSPIYPLMLQLGASLDWKSSRLLN
uniref:Conserved oligomeric Golgi complex subunit 5 helical domain-containing protein n=1 Tax=Physcomitrium patens TaxID=3218 RepID=A0A7I4ARB6_PHYPA